MSRNTSNNKKRTARRNNSEVLNAVLQLLNERGENQLAEGLGILINEAMRVECNHVLQAQPYERTEERKGYANGFKPQTPYSRVGPISLGVPQARGTEFYPSAREKGARSDQALKLTPAEMFVQGVSTREVSADVEQFTSRSRGIPDG